MKLRVATACLCLLVLAPAGFAGCGDINLDGRVDIVDSLFASRHAVGLQALLGLPLTNGDVTGDSQVNTLDALLIAQYVASLPVSLNCPVAPPLPLGTSQLYVATRQPHQVVIASADTYFLQKRLSLPAEPWSIAADPVRELVYVSDGTETVQVVDTQRDELDTPFVVPGLVAGVEVTPDGSALVGFSATGLVILDLPGRTVRHHVATGASIYGAGHLAITPDSAFAWVSDLDGEVIQVDLVVGAVSARIPVGAAPVGLDLSLDGSTLFVVNNGDLTLSLVDVATQLETLPRQPLGLVPLGITVHPNGSAYAVSCASHEITEHDPSSGQQTFAFAPVFEPMEIDEVGGDLAVVSAIDPEVSFLTPGDPAATKVDFGGSAVGVALK